MCQRHHWVWSFDWWYTCHRNHTREKEMSKSYRWSSLTNLRLLVFCLGVVLFLLFLLFFFFFLFSFLFFLSTFPLRCKHSSMGCFPLCTSTSHSWSMNHGLGWPYLPSALVSRKEAAWHLLWQVQNRGHLLSKAQNGPVSLQKMMM